MPISSTGNISSLFLYGVAFNLICLLGESIAVQLDLSIEWMLSVELISGLCHFGFNLLWVRIQVVSS